MPGTSVQISTRCAPSSAPKYAAEVSEPPRPRIAVPPSPWRAMKPCVSSIGAGCARSARAARRPASCRQFTDRRCAHALGSAATTASSQSRASHQPKSQALRAQVGRAERGRQQFALRQHFGLPVQRRASARARIGGQRAAARRGARRARRRHRGRVRAQNARWRSTSASMRASTSSPSPIGDRLQFVGDARQRRHHHQHARAVLGACVCAARRPMVSQRLRRDTEVPPNLSTTQRSASHGNGRVHGPPVGKRAF